MVINTLVDVGFLDVVFSVLADLDLSVMYLKLLLDESLTNELCISFHKE